MKMVKSAFLASAAGLVAMSGAQAADLPVKAKPVEYVKVCSLYGAGFYYIPGTDICMKVGGYVRFQQSYGTSPSITSGPVGANNCFNREHVPDYQYRNRAIATFDTRQQTAYGTLRTYLILGFTQDSVENTANPGAAAKWQHAVCHPRIHPDRGLHVRQGDLVLRLRVDGRGVLQRRPHLLAGYR